MTAWTTYRGVRVPSIPLGVAGNTLKQDLLALATLSIYRSATDPTADDDSGAGFQSGSEWLNISTNSRWTCLDPSDGAAIWRPVYARTEAGLAINPTDGIGGSTDTRSLQADTSGNVRGSSAVDFQRVRGSNSQVASGDCSIVLGKNCTASGAYSAARGLGSTASGNSASASGRYCTATGTNATASGIYCEANLSYCNASGNNSIAQSTYASSHGYYCTASGKHSYAHGSQNTASSFYSYASGLGCDSTGIFCIAQGSSSTASGYADLARGTSCTASGGFSVASGYHCSATAGYARADGSYATADKLGQQAVGCSSAGYQQSMLQWLGQTTNGTQAELFLNGTASERATLPASRVWTGHLDFQAVKTDQSKGVFGRKFFVIRRDNSNNTSLVGSITTIVADILLGSNSYAISIDADDTNESLRVQVTGATSETVNWKCTAYFSEVPTA